LCFVVVFFADFQFFFTAIVLLKITCTKEKQVLLECVFNKIRGYNFRGMSENCIFRSCIENQQKKQQQNTKDKIPKKTENKQNTLPQTYLSVTLYSPP
jgi:hypothetical protein